MYCHKIFSTNTKMNKKLEDCTVKELREKAKKKHIKCYYSMTKMSLIQALRRKTNGGNPWVLPSGKAREPSLRTIMENPVSCEGKTPQELGSIDNKCPAMCVLRDGVCRRSRLFLGLERQGPSLETYARRAAEAQIPVRS